MSMNNQGRPTGTGTAATAVSGSALIPDEPLLFEIGDTHHSGVDLPDAEIDGAFLGGFARTAPIDLAGLTEPEAMRHYVRLSQKNHAIDLALYPLGSCTMKHNPRLNEKAARMAGFADLHPLAPIATTQGALQLMDRLAHWLKTLTGMPAVALSPKAGAHGELCGLLCIKAAHEAKGQGHRRTDGPRPGVHGRTVRPRGPAQVRVAFVGGHGRALTRRAWHRRRTNREEPEVMLWTILIILAIIALVLFILGRVRGGRGV